MPYWHFPHFEELPMWLRRVVCRVLFGGHHRYTHVHHSEPPTTFCLRCRVTL